jgi:hypothetical protein
MMYAMSKASRPNYAAAGNQVEKAAEGGDLIAARHVCNLYRNGEGVDRNAAIANRPANPAANFSYCIHQPGR